MQMPGVRESITLYYPYTYYPVLPSLFTVQYSLGLRELAEYYSLHYGSLKLLTYLNRLHHTLRQTTDEHSTQHYM